MLLNGKRRSNWESFILIGPVME